MKAWVWLLVTCWFLGTASADRTITVGIHDDPPFVIKKGDQWTGVAVELLRSVGTNMHVTMQFVELPRERMTLGELPDVDLVAALNVSEKMNARYDLTHGFYSTGLAIATVEPDKEGTFAMVKRIFSGSFVLVLVVVGIALTLVGLLMWWLERRPVKPLPEDKKALSKALFWAFEPVIGYKASQHATRGGRVLGTIWGLFGVVLVSGLTANLAAQLTARRLAPTVKGVEDLPRVRVGVVAHTAGRKFCDKRGIARTEFDSLEEAMVALDHKKLDAVIDDAPNLAYALTRGHEHVVQLPGTFANHIYAFGLRPDSPLRKEINAALLEAIAGDAWTSTLASYLGKQN